MSRVPLPDDVDPRELDPQARQELRSLVRETADLVARHLVMTGRLLDEEPEQALAHARAARALAGRIGVVREASGLAAYAAGEWQEALSELRAARRITGDAGHLAVLADCERALGRPERALAVAEDPDVPRLTQDERVELVIVLSGARRDLGQADAAVLLLQDPATRTSAARPWAARLWYAYADALLAAGRDEQAREWFEKTAGIDLDGQTDAGDRLLELDGVVVDDEPDEDGDLADLPDADELAEVAQQVVRAHDQAGGEAKAADGRAAEDEGDSPGALGGSAGTVADPSRDVAPATGPEEDPSRDVAPATGPEEGPDVEPAAAEAGREDELDVAVEAPDTGAGASGDDGTADHHGSAAADEAAASGRDDSAPGRGGRRARHRAWPRLPGAAGRRGGAASAAPQRRPGGLADVHRSRRGERCRPR